MQRFVRGARLVVGLRVVGLTIAAAVMTACQNNNVVDVPTGPTPTVTETFTGTITINGAQTQPFAVLALGTITASLTSLTPDSAAVVSFALGTWNGTACQVILANDKATQGAILVGTSSSAGTFCARLSDVGTLKNATDYQIQIVHP